jgi:hypothetical protein
MGPYRSTIDQRKHPLTSYFIGEHATSADIQTPGDHTPLTKVGLRGV